MPDFYLLNVSAVDTRKALVKQFSSMRYIFNCAIGRSLLKQRKFELNVFILNFEIIVRFFWIFSTHHLKVFFNGIISFHLFSESELYKFAEYLHLVPSQESNSDITSSYKEDYLIEMIVSITKIFLEFMT